MSLRQYSKILAFPTVCSRPRGLLLEGRDDVQKANMVPFYWLGNSIGVLGQAVASSATINVVKTLGWTARGNLDYLVKAVGALPLSQKAARDLIDILDGVFSPKAGEVTKPAHGPEDSLSDEETLRLQTAIFHFQAVLASELEQSNLYYVDGIRAYDMTILINNGQWLLSEETLRGLGLPENKESKIVTDLREAARCLAFNVPTAVGFHIYRAIEAIVVDEYFPLHALVLPKHPNLGKYTEILKKVPIDFKVTNMLDHIREHYRNPISHPEEFWSQTQAVPALGVAIAVIELMMQDIVKTKTVSLLRGS